MKNSNLKMNWIEVLSGQLPEISEDGYNSVEVIVYIPGFGVRFGSRSIRGIWRADGIHSMSVNGLNVTHWMPKPENPV